MKLKTSIVVIYLLTLSGIFAMSKNNVTIVSGYIQSYGNEPFTFIGIETDEGKQYGISADEELYNEITEQYGVKIELEGTIKCNEKEIIMPNSLRDGIFEVHSWRVK